MKLHHKNKFLHPHLKFTYQNKIFKNSFILGYQTSADLSVFWIIHGVVW